MDIGTEKGFVDKVPLIGKHAYIGLRVKMYDDIRLTDGIIIGVNAIVTRVFDDKSYYCGRSCKGDQRGIENKKIYKRSCL